MSVLSFDCRHRYASGFTLAATWETSARVTALFGPSGSGKSTMLSIIAGWVRPDAGRVVQGARVLVDTAEGVVAPPQARRVGMVFQDDLLFPHLSVIGNLRYGLRRRRRDSRRAIRLERVVEVLELRELLDRRPRSLSGGERQRVALGRALLAGPEILLMDEPLAALDEELKMRILAYLERVVDEWNLSAIYVSHGRQEVKRLADWVVLLERGRVAGAGKPVDVFANA